MLLAIVIAVVVIALVVGVVRWSRRNSSRGKSASAGYLDRVAAQAGARGGKREHSAGYDDTPRSYRSPGGGGGA